MRRINYYLFVTMAMLMLSVNSAWAQYVKLTSPDGTVSWIGIEGIINGTNIQIYKPGHYSAIDRNTNGAIDLNEVWSGCGGGTNYQVTSIGSAAFSGCSGLTSVVIPSSVISIEDDAFDGCSGLTSVVIPSSVASIGIGAFLGCSGLTSVTIPSHVTNIEIWAFSDCSDLTSIVVEPGNTKYDSRNNCNAIIETATNTLIVGCKNTKIPSSVTSIKWDAFYGCSGLTSIVIPSSVTSIGGEAFYGCSGLTSVTIPSSVTSIGNSAFSDCSGLTSIVVKPGNTKYDSRNNCNAIIETASNTLIAGFKNTKIPSSVTSIGEWAFSGCSGLTSVVIPSSVTSIGQCAFQGCRGVTSIVIPSSVTSIGREAFNGCSGLTSITSYITDVFETGKYAFVANNNATLYVPNGLVSTYQSTADWNRIKKIEEIPSIPLAISCNNKGKVLINGKIEFTNDMGEVNVNYGVENTFTFQPNDNCELRQVLIDGLDVTLSVESNQLTTKVHEGSKMIVMFDKKGADVNGDGQLNISDVVALVNLILGQ